MPHKTRFHELAHVLLGHTSEGQQRDGQYTPRTLRECEAEAVALVCCAALELPGAEECRGYIQAWWGQGNTQEPENQLAELRQYLTARSWTAVEYHGQGRVRGQRSPAGVEAVPR